MRTNLKLVGPALSPPAPSCVDPHPEATRLASLLLRTLRTGSPEERAFLWRLISRDAARLPTPLGRVVAELADLLTDLPCDGGSLPSVPTVPDEAVDLLLRGIALGEGEGWLDTALLLARAGQLCRPQEGGFALHAARQLRGLGLHRRALASYRRALRLSPPGERVHEMARLGLARCSSSPGRSLAALARAASRRGDPEVAAVALELRADLPSRDGGRGGIRDLLLALHRHPAPSDRSRVMADLCARLRREGRIELKRRILLAGESDSEGPLRERFRERLLLLARDSGDQLGIRRWGGERTDGRRAASR